MGRIQHKGNLKMTDHNKRTHQIDMEALIQGHPFGKQRLLDLQNNVGMSSLTCVHCDEGKAPLENAFTYNTFRLVQSHETHNVYILCTRCTRIIGYLRGAGAQHLVFDWVESQTHAQPHALNSTMLTFEDVTSEQIEKDMDGILALHRATVAPDLSGLKEAFIELDDVIIKMGAELMDNEPGLEPNELARRHAAGESVPTPLAAAAGAALISGKMNDLSPELRGPVQAIADRLAVFCRLFQHEMSSKTASLIRELQHNTGLLRHDERGKINIRTRTDAAFLLLLHTICAAGSTNIIRRLMDMFDSMLRSAMGSRVKRPEGMDEETWHNLRSGALAETMKSVSVIVAGILDTTQFGEFNEPKNGAVSNTNGDELLLIARELLRARQNMGENHLVEPDEAELLGEALHFWMRYVKG